MCKARHCVGQRNKGEGTSFDMLHYFVLSIRCDVRSSGLKSNAVVITTYKHDLNILFNLSRNC